MPTLPKINLEIPKKKTEPAPLVKIKFSDLNIYRILSFRDAIDDFIKHSKEKNINSDGVWLLITQILSGQTNGEVWWALQGDKVVCYFILRGSAEFDGQPSLLITHGWADRSLHSAVSHYYLNVVADDAFKRGACRVWFMTRRNPRAYQRWLGSKWANSGYVFERR